MQLQAASPIQRPPSEQANVTVFEEPNSSRVWSHLETCASYEAARVVGLAAMLLHVSRPDFDPLEANKELHIMKYIDGDFLSVAHQSLGNSHAASYCSRLFQGCLEAVFLRQTILEDIDLILLEGSCGVIEKAKALASLGALSAKSPPELLQFFLDSAEVQLEEATAELAALGKGQGKLGIALVSEKLFLTISILQTTLLDAYNIFFKPTISPAIASVGDFDGLLSRFQAEFNVDLTISMKALLRFLSNHYCVVEANIADDVPLVDTSAFMKDLQAKVSKTQLRSIFDSWLGRIIMTISSRCKVALGCMDSAFEVAKLQQKVWSGCCTYVPKPAHMQQQVQYAQSDWIVACEELLSAKLVGSKHLRTKDIISKISSKDSSDSADAGSFTSHSTHLWSAVFRGPFMVQVERLLQQSCHAVMLRAKQQLVEALALEGLNIDPITFQISVASSHGKSIKGFTSNGFSGSTTCMLGDDLTPSPRIFRRAEFVRSLLEDEITDMFGEMLSPVHTGDAFSTTAFSRAMFIQCSQLVPISTFPLFF